jgi:hypothetical protein
VLQVGFKARGVALSLGLPYVFIMLWVAIGAGIHKNYETPTPVRNPPLFFPILSSLLTLFGSILVLDQLSVLAGTPWLRNHLAVDRTICFGNTIRSTVFLGGRSLVGR